MTWRCAAVQGVRIPRGAGLPVKFRGTGLASPLPHSDDAFGGFRALGVFRQTACVVEARVGKTRQMTARGIRSHDAEGGLISALLGSGRFIRTG
jgi:hypothetical protein